MQIFFMNTISHMNLLLEHFDYKTLFAYICMVIIIKQKKQQNRNVSVYFFFFFQILIICMSVVIFKDLM